MLPQPQPGVNPYAPQPIGPNGRPVNPNGRGGGPGGPEPDDQ
jgi:hypothetical protein